jgi:hypothetical protein
LSKNAAQEIFFWAKNWHTYCKISKSPFKINLFLFRIDLKRGFIKINLKRDFIQINLKRGFKTFLFSFSTGRLIINRYQFKLVNDFDVYKNRSDKGWIDTQPGTELTQPNFPHVQNAQGLDKTEKTKDRQATQHIVWGGKGAGQEDSKRIRGILRELDWIRFSAQFMDSRPPVWIP